MMSLSKYDKDSFVFCLKILIRVCGCWMGRKHLGWIASLCHYYLTKKNLLAEMGKAVLAFWRVSAYIRLGPRCSIYGQRSVLLDSFIIRKQFKCSFNLTYF